VRACGELEAKSAIGDVLELLLDDEPKVRLAAIFALGRIGGKKARDALRIISDSGEPDEVEAADEALDEMNFFADPNATPLLEETADEDEEDEWDGEPWSDRSDDNLGEYDKD
jgi:HEAT repeat protein